MSTDQNQTIEENKAGNVQTQPGMTFEIQSRMYAIVLLLLIALALTVIATIG